MDRENENKLLKCKSLNEFLTMLFGYGINEQLSIFDEFMTIKAGTSLYRARKDDIFMILSNGLCLQRNM